VLLLALTFFERNPGIARLMMGDPLVGEAPRLKPRVRQLFDRIETECRQLIRDEQLESMANAILTPSEQTILFMHMLEGAIARFVRSEFNASPTEHFAAYWPVLASGMDPKAR
jgi:TetR/AcrR family transcriptional regulator